MKRALEELVLRFPEHSHLSEELSEDNALEDFESAVKWICSGCGDELSESVHSRLRRPRGKGQCHHLPKMSSLWEPRGDALSSAPETILSRFDWERNAPLTPEDFSLRTQRKVWWHFEDCGHSRYMSVSNVTLKGQGCGEPECRAKSTIQGRISQLSFERSLAADQLLSALWSTSNPLKAREVSRHSNNEWLWRCDCGEEWRSAPPNTGYRYFACPQCSPLLRVEGSRNSALERHGGPMSLTHPELWSQSDHLKNSAQGIDAESIYYLLTTVKTWWICRDCAGSYAMTPAYRYRGKPCPLPLCANRRIGELARERAWKRRGSFEDAHPELLEEFDYEKNLRSPGEIRASSDEPIWWICSKGHSWSQTLRNRLIYGNGCKVESNGLGSKMERDVIAEILKASPYLTYIANRRGLARGYKRGFELDLYFPDLSRGIEVNGNFWHSEERFQSGEKKGWDSAEGYHGTKRARFEDVGIAIVFLWEYDWIMDRSAMLEELLEFLESGKISPRLSALTHRETRCYLPVAQRADQSPPIDSDDDSGVR